MPVVCAEKHVYKYEMGCNFFSWRDGQKARAGDDRDNLVPSDLLKTVNAATIEVVSSLRR